MKLLKYGVLLVSLCLSGGAVAQEAKDLPEGSVPMPPANWLFVQTADAIASDGKTLTLKGVAPQTLMFTDRPERMTGDAPTDRFVAYWTGGKSDFEKDPPNATVSMSVDGKLQLAVVELMNPKLEGDSLTYDIKMLEGDLPKSAGATSLFIDWWYGPGWRWGPRPWVPRPWWGGGCWRGPYGGLHCRPYW